MLKWREGSNKSLIARDFALTDVFTCVWVMCAAMVPELWLTEGGQSATGALLDHLVETHPAAATLANSAASQSEITPLLAKFLACLLWLAMFNTHGCCSLQNYEPEIAFCRNLLQNVGLQVSLSDDYNFVLSQKFQFMRCSMAYWRSLLHIQQCHFTVL